LLDVENGDREASPFSSITISSCQIRFDRLAICTAAKFSAAIFSSRLLKTSSPAARAVVREIAVSVGRSVAPQ
jgi:hypothetical protein